MSDDNKTPIATSTTTNATTTDVDDTTDVPNLESEDKNKQQQRSKNNNNNNNNNNNISSPTTTTTTTHQQLLEDNSDHSAVMVDHKDAEEHRGALQIVRIGSEENAYAFEYQKDQLESITKRIPSGMKVAVVSVVGAFRTGKSFLLSFFLRYLHSLEHPEEFEDENNNRKEWYELSDSLKSYDGFHWRAGSERDTTGIWMWSHPYIINNVAVLLVDTQGMFDNETTMKLTASIFGLSTLLSSYQIYNVDKMIGEDVLQQLGLFTEYGRVASDNSRNEKQKKKKNNDKPFQKVEFLVRDWQHFEEEEDVVKMAAEMDKVLEKVMSDRDAHDLKETREQIVACFDKITIYGLVHPGFAVTKKSYNGEVDKIEPVFLRLLDQYCRRVFTNLEPKTIHGRQITGPELATFIEAYAEMFKTGADFPAATTMLEATSAASNTNAINLAMEEYKNSMDRVAGPQASNYVKEDELAEDHKQFVSRSLDKFNSIATFGSKSSIEKSKRDLLGKIDKDFEMYKSLNNGRNPLLGLELYMIPMLMGLFSWITGKALNYGCAGWSDVCRSGVDLFDHTWMVVACFLAILAFTKAKQIQAVWNNVLQPMLTGGANSNNKGGNPSLRGGAKAKNE